MRLWRQKPDTVVANNAARSSPEQRRPPSDHHVDPPPFFPAANDTNWTAKACTYVRWSASSARAGGARHAYSYAQ